MGISELGKVCAVIPRNLGKGAQTPPPLHPPLYRPPAGIEPAAAECSVSPLHHDHEETSLSPWNPIDQDRETSLSPWTAPSTSRFAAGPRARPPAAFAAMAPVMVITAMAAVMVTPRVVVAMAMMPGMMMAIMMKKKIIIVMPPTKEPTS